MSALFITLIIIAVIALVALFFSIIAMIRASRSHHHHGKHGHLEDHHSHLFTPHYTTPHHDHIHNNGHSDNLIIEGSSSGSRYEIISTGYRIQGAVLPPLALLPAATNVDPDWQLYVSMVDSSGVKSARIPMGPLRQHYGKQYNVFDDVGGAVDVELVELEITANGGTTYYIRYDPVSRYNSDHVIFTVATHGYQLF